MILLLLSFGLATVVAYPAPGLLRVPRVYNALVTSNQNLSPSRAFPVIQPVVHTTAVGYVPPFYYTEFAPRYPGPEAGRVDQELLPAEDAKVEIRKDADAADSTEEGTQGPSKDSGSDDKGKPISNENSPNGNDNPHDLDSLSFYPNYQSLYLDPYAYTYNGFATHLPANPYLFHYQPQPLPPLPPQGSENYQNQRLLPYHAEVPRNGKSRDLSEKIPDVPPPPVPTSSSSKQSQG